MVRKIRTGRDPNAKPRWRASIRALTDLLAVNFAISERLA
jgi:hypothetical protein